MKEAQISIECITKEFNHIYQFLEANNGSSKYVCKVCGWIDEVIEDSQP